MMTSIPYDSTPDTTTHIHRVGELLDEVIVLLQERKRLHDLSKLASPEKQIFDEFTPKLKTSTYGSVEYQQFLQEMGQALNHHHICNRHHPEHFTDGIQDMSLIDLVEMFCDWKAATERHVNGDLSKSIQLNRQRFGLSHQLVAVLHNTQLEMKW